MCTEEIIRPCETYEICEYLSFFIITLIRFAMQLTGNMERLHAAFLLPFKQYAVYLFPLLLVHQNTPMRCLPIAHFSVQYISHNRELIEENELPLFFKRRRMVMVSGSENLILSGVNISFNENSYINLAGW